MALVFSNPSTPRALGSMINTPIYADQQNFHVSIEGAQIYLFAFLAAVGGRDPWSAARSGDRIWPASAVIWGSIVGVIPFTLARRP